MRPTRDLPPNYHPQVTLDLTRNPRLLLWLNVIGFGLLVASAGLFLRMVFWLRPHEAAAGLAFAISGLGDGLKTIVVLVLAVGAMIGLHEGTHGLFFWLFSGARPVFTFKGYYASAAVPGWYIPRNPYLVVSLAPLVLITLLGIVLLAILPPAWFPALLLVMVLNTSGAVGDLLVAFWLLKVPADTLAYDQGDSITLYVRTADSALSPGE